MPNRRQILDEAEADIVRAYHLMRGRDADRMEAAGWRGWTRVYLIVDPRNDEVFYVGSGNKSRFKQHLKEASRGVGSNKCDRIREIWAAGKHVEFRVVGLFNNRRRARAWEIQVARDYGNPNLKFSAYRTVASPPA